MSRQRLRRTFAVVISCEHGGKQVPSRYRHLFENKAARAALDSHRGWDPGSLDMARELQRQLHAPLIACRRSRLLVELNRSCGHHELFSEWTRRLPEADRHVLVTRFYHPHRYRVFDSITSAHTTGQDVVHLSVHTFTPIWKGRMRSTDVGLLFDPARVREAALCRSWQQKLRRRLPHLRIHRNRPYRGTSDGLTTDLRRRLPDDCYLGIEVEINQRLVTGRYAEIKSLGGAIATSLRDALAILA